MLKLDVTVTIPTYNGSAFIADAVRSVFKQTLPPQQILVVDDCSTDATLEVVQGLTSEAPVPLGVVRLPKNSGGPAEPLNQAIATATGDWVAILEQDDAMPPDRLERQAAAVVEFPSARFCSGRAAHLPDDAPGTEFFWGCRDQFAAVLDDPGVDERHVLIPRQRAFRALLEQQFLLTNSSFIFHKSLWSDLGGFDPCAGSCSDLAFALGAVALSDLALVNAPVVYYRTHAASLNHRDPLGAVLKARLIQLDFAGRHPALAPDEWRHIYWDLRLFKLRDLWRARRWGACTRLICQLGRLRLGRQWQN